MESTETADTTAMHAEPTWNHLVFMTHRAAMAEVAQANSGGINIHGKKYTTVSKRVEIFRRHFGPHARLRISESQIGDNAVRMTAVIEMRAEEGGWEVVAEGRAEEIRTERGINSTSALEVCETSAYGRALANFGLHGGEFASANEVEQAIKQQGDRSGRPDTSKVDPDIADQYAQRMWDIVQAEDSDRATKLHWEMNEDEALYTAATDIYRGICKTNKFSYGGDKWKKLLNLNNGAEH